jgi:hypothetical protein
MTDFATSTAATFRTTLDTAGSYVAKTFSDAAQAYPQLAEYYELANDVYANPPSVDQVYNQTITTITQKAPWMVSQVQSQLAKIPNKEFELTEVDKAAVLAIMAISALAFVFIAFWMIKKLVSSVFGSHEKIEPVSKTMAKKSPKSARKSASPKGASAAVEETVEAEPENVTKSVAKKTATKTPRMRTPGKATVAAEAATVESATPAPAKVLDFGVTPKKGATSKKSDAVVEESSSKKVSAADENATPRRSARLASLAEKAPMPSVEETEPVTLPVENPIVTEWDKLTVPDLKAELKRRGEKVGQQRKAELVERLQALDREGATA